LRRFAAIKLRNFWGILGAQSKGLRACRNNVLDVGDIEKRDAKYKALAKSRISTRKALLPSAATTLRKIRLVWPILCALHRVGFLTGGL
jgi:hypothetical protein